MNASGYFKRIGHRRPALETGGEPNSDTFEALLRDRVVERFARMSGLNVLAIPLGLPGLENAEDPPQNPVHAACAEFADTAYCRESWQLHLAELKRRPEALWHRCDHGRLCALVPLVCQGRCLAAIKLACPEPTPEDSFERNVELLDVLVENVVTSEGEFLARLLSEEQPAAERAEAPAGQADVPGRERPRHPQVLRALEYIEHHLSDPRLTVGRVALELHIHADYLAHLFAEQVGQRMSRHIAARRIELAKDLLATTDWQIKRVASETGFANPNWFSHVFNAHIGATPGEYRRKTRHQQARRRRIS